MLDIIKGVLRKRQDEDENYSENKCSIHSSLKKTVESAIYYAVDEYTNSQYIRMVENLSKINFLTIINSSPLIFQVGTSNVMLSPERYGDEVLFYSGTVIRREPSFMDRNGYLLFNTERRISFEEAFELLNEEDQKRIVFTMDVFLQK